MSSKSIWNENPTFYLSTRLILFSTFSLVYPISLYAILKKSPKNFGSLKWFLLVHWIAMLLQWLAGFIFINFYTFVPSKITRIEGILTAILDIPTLYFLMYGVYFLASASSLLLFCNRIFSILNMYRGVKSFLRHLSEILIYILAFLMPSVVLYGLTIPDQLTVKAMTKQISPYYPDCVDDPHTIVFLPPDPANITKKLLFYLIYILFLTIVTILTAQVSYFLLSKRMSNQSERTQKMHRKFNRRTLFQVLINISFTSIPFTISNLATLFQWRIPEMTYFVDFSSKFSPTACILILFIYYDPYQNWILQIFVWKQREQRRTGTTVIKSADF